MSSKSKFPNKIGPYMLRGTIGEGAFSIVKLAFDSVNKLYYACKIVPKSRLSSNSLEKRFEEEIRINQQLHHPGLVSLIDIIQDEQNYYVVMEFCPNGELFQYIVDRGRLLEDEAKPKIKMILESVKYIHQLGITHRDLKPENILLDQYGQPKISDFGLSRFVGPDNLVSTPCGSPCYASPECISGSAYNGITSDVWSCGVVLFAMVTGQLPWTKRNQQQLFEQIRSGEYTIPSFLSQQCSSIIKGLMTVDITKRLTIDDALNHPWLASTKVVDVVQSTSAYVSMKRVDEYFHRTISSLHLEGLKSRCSVPLLTFDDQLKQIVGNADAPTMKIKKKVKRIKKIGSTVSVNRTEKDESLTHVPPKPPTVLLKESEKTKPSPSTKRTREHRSRSTHEKSDH